MADTDTIEVTFTKQKVFHNGTSMIVAKAGDSFPVEERQVAGLLAESAIEAPDGWEEKVVAASEVIVADGAVHAAPPVDLADDEDGEPQLPALSGKTKAELLAIAADEGAIVADGATNAEIVAAIEAARADENPPE